MATKEKNFHKVTIWINNGGLDDGNIDIAKALDDAEFNPEAFDPLLRVALAEQVTDMAGFDDEDGYRGGGSWLDESVERIARAGALVNALDRLRNEEKVA